MLNPSFAELEESFLDMVVAGTEEAVLMVESEAKELEPYAWSRIIWSSRNAGCCSCM